MTGRADVAALRRECINVTQIEPWGEAAAVAVLLGFEPVAADKRFAAHVDRDGINWDAVLADETWSTGERFLIATAAGLWSGRPHGADVCRSAFLDDDFYEVWLAMVTASRTGKVPGDG